MAPNRLTSGFFKPTHFRAWKRGKTWLFAASVLAALIGGTLSSSLLSTPVQAAVVVSPSDSAATSLSSASSALSSAASAATAQSLTVTSTRSDSTPTYHSASSVTVSAVSEANASNQSAYSSAASLATSSMSSAAQSLSSVTSSYSSAVSSYNATEALSNSSETASYSATLSSAGSALSTAITSAAQGSLTLTLTSSLISPSYVSAASDTIAALSLANAINTSLYGSAVSSAANLMSAEESALASLVSSYDSALTSYHAVTSSLAAQSTALSSNGIAVTVTSQTATAGRPNELNFASMSVLLSSGVSLESLLGSEYVVGALFPAAGTALAYNHLTNATAVTEANGSVTFTPTQPTQPITMTLTNVGKTNTGHAVNVAVSLTPVGGGSIGLDYNNNLSTTGAAATLTLTLVDAITGAPVSMLVNGQLTNVNAFSDGSPSPTPDPGGAMISGLGDLSFQLPSNVTLETTNGQTLYQLTSPPLSTNINFFGIINGTVTLTENWAAGGLTLNSPDSLYTEPTPPSATVVTYSVPPAPLEPITHAAQGISTAITYETVTPPTLQSTVTLQLVGQLAHGTTTLQTLTLVGNVGETYAYTLPIIPYYRLPATPTITGTYTAQDQTVTVPYQAELGSLTINYINVDTGLPLLPSLTLSNHLGDYQIIRQPYLTNYHPINTGNETLFQQVLPYETRTFYYAPNTEQVVVNYLNTKGQVIQPSTILTGTYGSSQIIEAPPITGYTQSNTQVQNVVLTYNSSIQTLNFVYTPVEGSIHFIFENEWGEQVAAPVTYTGDYGTAYSYNPPTLPYMNLTSASESSIGGIYSQNKETVIVHYVHYQAQITVIDMDDWGNILHTYSVKSLEGNSYNFTNPSYWWLKFVNPSQQVLKGIYNQPNETITVLYKHYKTSVTFEYLGTNGAYLGSGTTTGWANTSYGYIVPHQIGNYYNYGNTYYTGIYQATNRTIDIYFTYVPPIVYYYTSDPSAGTYFANGNEYVPIYVPSPSYNSGGGGSSTGSGGSSTPYNPDSPWDEYGGNNSGGSGNSQSVWSIVESFAGWLRDQIFQGLLNAGVSSLIAHTFYDEISGTGIGAILDFGEELSTGESVNNARNKAFIHASLSDLGMALGMLIPVPVVDLLVGVLLGILFCLVFDWVYNKLFEGKG